MLWQFFLNYLCSKFKSLQVDVHRNELKPTVWKEINLKPLIVNDSDVNSMQYRYITESNRRHGSSNLLSCLVPPPGGDT